MHSNASASGAKVPAGCGGERANQLRGPRCTTRARNRQSGTHRCQADGVDVLAVINEGHAALGKADAVLARANVVELLQLLLAHEAVGDVRLHRHNAHILGAGGRGGHGLGCSSRGGEAAVSASNPFLHDFVYHGGRSHAGSHLSLVSVVVDEKFSTVCVCVGAKTHCVQV